MFASERMTLSDAQLRLGRCHPNGNSAEVAIVFYSVERAERRRGNAPDICLAQPIGLGNVPKIVLEGQRPDILPPTAGPLPSVVD